jgi:DNA-binding XRE family transcriptional regulator
MNKVKAFRLKKNLTQRELAEKAGTSQQQIQRIETGQIAARLDLALRISTVLEKPLSAIFPGSKQALEKLQKEKELGYIDGTTLSRISDHGIEADNKIYYFKFLLRGHSDEIILSISPQESRRLFKLVQLESGTKFIVFDGDEYAVALNLSQLVYCHFLFEVLPFLPEPDQEEHPDLKVYFNENKNHLSFQAEPDHLEEDGTFRSILSFLESDPEDSERIHFEDVDGESVFIRIGDIALLYIPLWVLEFDFNEAE